jgi:hypothetical protein
MVKINRTIAISPNESRQRSDKFKVLDQFLIERMNNENLVDLYPILAEYNTLCGSRRIYSNELQTLLQ